MVAFLFVATPAISLLTGWPTHHTWLPEAFIGLVFVNLVMGVGMIFVSLQHRLGHDRITIRDAFLQYSLITNSMFIFMRAAINAMLGRYIGFVTTSKTKSHTGLSEIRWNLALSAAAFGLSIYALYHTFAVAGAQNIRTYLPISLWLLFYSVLFASSLLFVEPAPRPANQPSYTAYATRSTN